MRVDAYHCENHKCINQSARTFHLCKCVHMRIAVTFRKITASIATSNVYRTFARKFYFHSSFDTAFIKARMCIPRNFQLMRVWKTAGFVRLSVENGSSSIRCMWAILREMCVCMHISSQTISSIDFIRKSKKEQEKTRGNKGTNM